MNDNTREALQDLEKRCADCNLREIIWLALDDYDRAEVIASILRTHDRAAADIEKETNKIETMPQYWNEYTEEEKAIYYELLELDQEYFEDMKATITHTQEALTILQATEAEKAVGIETNRQRAEQPTPPPLTNAEQQEVMQLFLQSDNAELREMAQDCLERLISNEEGTRH